MKTSLDYCQDIKELLEKVSQLEKTIRYGEYGHKFSSVLENYGSLFNRFCPFDINDRVALSSTPIISKEIAPGWQGCKHFLIEGATGTVCFRDYYQERFRFGVRFDLDSWIDPISKEVKLVLPEKRGLFMLSEDMLVASSTN